MVASDLSVDHILSLRQLSAALGGGLPLVVGLGFLAQHAAREEHRQVWQSVRRRVEEGEPLHAAMEGHGAFFGGLAVAAVKAGESRGVLDEALERLCDVLDEGRRLELLWRSGRLTGAASDERNVLLFCRGLGLLCWSGVPLLEAMKSCAEGLDSGWALAVRGARVRLAARAEHLNAEGLARALGSAPPFPPATAALIGLLGASEGLDRALDRIAGLQRRRLEGLLDEAARG